MQLSALAERAISVRKDGRQLARMAVLQVIVPVVPPWTDIRFLTAPTPGAYASIGVFFRFSPTMMPGVFQIERQVSGAGVLPLVLSTLVLSEGCPAWMEITMNDTLHTYVRNRSGANQYFELEDVMLVVDTKPDFQALIAVLGEV